MDEDSVCVVSLANHLSVVADAFRPLRTHQCYWTFESWTSQKWCRSNCFHTASSQSRKYIWTRSKCTKRYKRCTQTTKELLETLFFGINICTEFPKDIKWINTRCAESLANHLRATADVFCPLFTHQRYWTTKSRTSHKWSPFNRWHTACGKSQKYILERNHNARNDGHRRQPLNSF